MTPVADHMLQWSLAMGASASLAALVARPTGSSSTALIGQAIGALQREARTADPVRAWALEAASRMLLAVLSTLEAYP